MPANFERKRRIVKTDEFSSVFRLRPLIKTDHLTLYAKPNALTHARLGVVAAKRFAPRAVTRNAVKRAVREGFRQSDLMQSMGLDCVVLLSKPLGKKGNKGNQLQPACTAAMQALLFNEVLSLFSNTARLNKALMTNQSGESTKEISE